MTGKMENIRHLGIVVENINKSLVFYRDLLGLKIKRDMKEKGSYIDKVLGLRKVNVRTVKLAAKDGCLIELLNYHFPVSKKAGKNRINDIGCSHVAFTVKNIEKEYLFLSNKGVIFNSRPQESEDGLVKVVFCRDPDGTFVELVEILKKNKTIGKAMKHKGAKQ